MNYTIIKFGRNNGKTLPQIVLSDPSWFFWAYGDGIFNKHGFTIMQEAKDIYYKAKNIKLPTAMEVEYYFQRSPKPSFAYFLIVPSNTPKHQGTTITFRCDHLDMNIASLINVYISKNDNKLFIKDMKFWFWNDKSLKLTKKFCEDFFDDSNNFV
jgi:hypothetical protein